MINTYVELLCDSHHGIYIPQTMASRLLDNNWTGITEENLIDCSDPVNEWYWDAWNTICDNAQFIDESGIVWLLWHDGDLWAYRADMPDDVFESFTGAC